jgi:hypothetical protein
MKESKTTRFEVGMKVMVSANNEWHKTFVTSIHLDEEIVFASVSDMAEFAFKLQGFALSEDEPFLIAFTLPEYEALKALTDSFVDGTFGKEKVPKEFTYPTDNTKNLLELFQADAEQPETTDLLDDYGRTVYFTDGMEVGSLAYGKGKVTDIDVDNGNICASFEGKSDYWHTFDGRSFTGGNQTLYPIEQYNQITLPKLKPIQVPKPKADVIELPSWFKGGAIIHSQCVSDYFWDNYNDKSNILESFGKIITKVGADGAPQLTFYACRSANDGVISEFVFNNKLYTAFIRYGIEPNEAPAVTAFYEKNGVFVTEIL